MRYFTKSKRIEEGTVAMNDYKFKTKPYAHQQKAFDLCKNKDVYALLMEQGTGKTKVAIDKASHQYCEGKINAVLIVAPNGVHNNWVQNEIHKHIPEYIKYSTLVWKKNKKFLHLFDNLLSNKDTLCFFAINIEALGTEDGRNYVKRYLMFKNVLMIIDESSRIKTPNTIRTKAAIALGKLAKQRLIMTGTPITQSPFDLYAQFKFLDPFILHNQTYTAFKHEYGNFSRKVNFKTGYPYDELISYKNLESLQGLITDHSFRVTKDACLDLPPKIYQRYSVELSRDQRRHYEELKEQLFTEINGKEVLTTIILTKILRLQQITGGFITFTDENYAVPVGDENPKIEMLMSLIEDIPHKIIIWARFSQEIIKIVEQLKIMYGKESTVAYWGQVSNNDRAESVERFQNDEKCRFFVGNARAGGIGLTLTAANTMIYYSNDFSLETRLQSEDRAHRIGQKRSVTYIDIEALDTLDDKIITALRSKKNVADLITGDNVKEWI